MKPKLLFVYNAKTGFFNKLTDLTHKIVSPGTYPCSLCALTYGKFNMFEEWAEYIENLPLEVEFQYKDEWQHRDVYDQYPLVALQREQKLEVLLRAEELNAMKTLEELKNRLNEVLQRVPS
ncbi:hypothetical protein POKO110462_14300 [Pontibacter korlensis]|uniref:GTPase n=1 Tax=Pontibacter korlensis TaxID=400092 RepID=A0A0E3UZA4_9BACT|nr:hypothetical protein [Pontibacter korlensis]AKD05146.1 hypothetical protein PKOR_21290 [Pontibacter korlensis]